MADATATMPPPSQAPAAPIQPKAGAAKLTAPQPRFRLPNGEVVTGFPADGFVKNRRLLEHPKRFKFQVMGGAHMEPQPVLDDDGCMTLEPVAQFGEQLLMPDGKPIFQIKARDVMFGPRRPAGDIVDTDSDLAKLHNRRGQPIKFTRLGADGDARAEELGQLHGKRAAAQARERQRLERLPVRQLIEMAEAEEIDLHGATKHADVLRIILADMAAKDA